jgi:predicted ribosome quality control (RQC) complex YloA/Tae2 family protein
MAFDGIVVANLVHDFKLAAEGGRISKIAQPEPDELLLTIKKGKETNRIVLSASASLPLAYLTSENKLSPMTAPNFCMMLRKHIANGLILSISQPDMDRIIRFEIEHYNDMGDLCKKFLYLELMGKRSNLIFCTEEDIILDSIKHISSNMSSLREVLPGRPYFIPKTAEKQNPLLVTETAFMTSIKSSPAALSKAIYTSFNGFSPLIASEICYRSGLDAYVPASEYSEDHLKHLWNNFHWMMEDIKEGKFQPNIIFRDNEPIEFSVLELSQYEDCISKPFDSISQVLKTYYSEKEKYARIRQKSADLRKIVSTDLERCRRKYDLQLKQLKDTEKREKYRIYGELLNAYGYQLTAGEKNCEVLNYYTNEMLTIPLDPQKTPSENAQSYFERYNKLKRTHDDLENRTVETQLDLEHLRSVSNSLDIAVSEADLSQIREELVAAGYLRPQTGKKKKGRNEKSQPFHYRSSDGFDIYVGKNNLQNDELTFKVANGGDWWFHAKHMPGSHVIVRTGGQEMTDRAFEEAGSLAAYYSAGRDSEKVEIDYLQRKNIKKPNGAKPGYVVYYTNYSLNAIPNISHLELISE